MITKCPIITESSPKKEIIEAISHLFFEARDVMLEDLLEWIDKDTLLLLYQHCLENQPVPKPITQDSSRMDIINSILKMVYVKHPGMDYVDNIEEALPYMSKEDLLTTHAEILKIYLSGEQ